MDIKSKKYNKVLYGSAFVLCILSFLTTLAGILIVTEVDSGGVPDKSWLFRSIGVETIYIGVIAAGLICLATLLYLVIATGERDQDGKVVLHFIDRIFTEVSVLLVGLLFVYGGFLFMRFSYEAVRYLIRGDLSGEVFFYPDPFFGFRMMNLPFEGIVAIDLVIGILTAGFGLWLLLSLVRKIKARVFFRTSLIGRLVLWIYGAIRTIYDVGGTQRKVVLLALGICVLSAFTPLAPFVFVAILILSARWIGRYDQVRQGIDEARQGNFNHRVPVAEGETGELAWMARSINEISDASKAAVEKEGRNQRLKTELISNVSHDLKTPLTSIIAYIDLLKTEGLNSPEAPKYLEVLDQKTNRLKQLTEDLFEAAKASSGDMPVRLESIEMVSVARQALGEMSSRVEEAGLDFILSTPEEKYYAVADGQLMWRVMENLISNAVKYALPGSRVYIDLSTRTNKKNENPMVVLEMKNISKDPLNISPAELMERFTRGDESRTSDGSGLGLAITKDLMKLQKGWFDIRIDGDLFKAVVLIPQGTPPETDEGASEKEAADETGHEDQQGE